MSQQTAVENKQLTLRDVVLKNKKNVTLVNSATLLVTIVM